MPAMLPIFALELLLLLLSLAPYAVLSTHVRCSWKPGPGEPSKYGYAGYCLAGLTDESATSADYRCLRSPGVANARVADWGKRGREVLEWHSPCGSDGGYGVVNGQCASSHWALCLGPSANGNCLYMAAEDDCEWPDSISLKTLPVGIEVWFYRN